MYIYMHIHTYRNKFDTTLPATSTVNVTPPEVSTTEGMQNNHTKVM